MPLLIVSGPPGAGKTTVSTLLADRLERSVLVAGDDFFGFLASGRIEPWLPASHSQNTIVTEAAALATGRFAADYDTIYDGIVGPWFLPTFVAASGVDVLDYVMVLPTLDTCLHRIATRTGHGFSDEAAARKMHAEFAAATIADRHVLVDDGGGPASAVEWIEASRRDGRLRYRLCAPTT